MYSHEHSLSFFQRCCKFESNTSSDWLNCMVLHLNASKYTKILRKGPRTVLRMVGKYRPRLHVSGSDCALLEGQYTTNVTCTYDPVYAVCPVSQVIAIENITVGAQLNDTDCPTLTACCERRITSCEFDFPLDDFTRFFPTCNAQQSCSLSAQPDLPSKGNCPDDVFQLTSYMFWEFYCIPRK